MTENQEGYVEDNAEVMDDWDETKDAVIAPNGNYRLQIGNITRRTGKDGTYNYWVLPITFPEHGSEFSDLIHTVFWMGRNHTDSWMQDRKRECKSLMQLLGFDAPPRPSEVTGMEFNCNVGSEPKEKGSDQMINKLVLPPISKGASNGAGSSMGV